MPDITHFAAGFAHRSAIARETGAGGTATVYLAGDLKHERPTGSAGATPEGTAGGSAGGWRSSSSAR